MAEEVEEEVVVEEAEEEVVVEEVEEEVVVEEAEEEVVVAVGVVAARTKRRQPSARTTRAFRPSRRRTRSAGRATSACSSTAGVRSGWCGRPTAAWRWGLPSAA